MRINKIKSVVTEKLKSMFFLNYYQENFYITLNMFCGL
jgi:hypothetical protein